MAFPTDDPALAIALAAELASRSLAADRPSHALVQVHLDLVRHLGLGFGRALEPSQAAALAGFFAHLAAPVLDADLVGTPDSDARGLDADELSALTTCLGFNVLATFARLRIGEA